MSHKGTVSPEHVAAVNRSVKEAFCGRPSTFASLVALEKVKKTGIEKLNPQQEQV